MEYKLNLGVWNSVFAVPTEIVDKHLKLAGAAQLKVLLWFLRYSGAPFNVDDISEELAMPAADVNDCLQYWVQTGIIALHDGIITPAESNAETIVSQNDNAEEISEEETAVPPKEQSNSKRTLSRAEKPDAKYIAQRICEDKNVEYLMHTAEEIFGRLTSHNDKATLLLIHENDGLPIEVIIMLLQYAAEIGKCNMRYIEKIAISWADEEITTLEAAERKIKQLTSGRTAAKKLQKIIGLDDHSPTEKETDYASRWLNTWKFSADMIRYAYEICVDAKGKYIPNYVNTILERWHSTGIKNIENARLEQIPKKKQQSSSDAAAYDIEEYESTSIVDEED